jgi:hypothetical protein
MTIQENVDTIIAEAIARAQDQTIAADDAVGIALQYASTLAVPSAVDDVDEVDVPSDMAPPTGTTYEDTFRTEMTAIKGEILASLNSEWNDFLTTYFPAALNAAAQAWLLDAINNGGTGIEPIIEDAIWERGRERILDEMAQAEQNVTSQFASLGWPNPPGSLASRLRRIQEEARIKSCEWNRDTAIQAAKMEQENVQFAISKSIELIRTVWDAARNFVDALIRAYDPAVRAGAGVADAAAEFYRQTLDYYRLVTAYEELQLRQGIQNQNVDLDETKIGVGVIDARAIRQTKAAMAAAQVYGEQAAASLSGQNTMATQVIQELA